MSFASVSPQSPVPADRLIQLTKPAQYLGGELNAVYKDPAAVQARIALAFPDTYTVGMSHLGLQILYQALNAVEFVWAERVYMPLPDMETLLRSGSLPLFSLESRLPLRQFDILGFSLQYELCGTNILAMLELGGIPFLAKDRTAEDPLVIGGGPYSYHPEALAPFFDAFLLGDAEEASIEIAAVAAHKRHGISRADLLAELAAIDGIYLPNEFEPSWTADGKLSAIVPLNPARPQIKRRLLPSLAGAPGASKPVVPNIRTIHNRLAIEVMRGCVRGCRFCQAGYLYRPQRERPPAEIFEMVRDALPRTGFEELSLLSLSTADYCSVVPLLASLIEEYGTDDTVAISFPSTRVDALTPELLDQAKRVRRGGFTVAPEAGSQRLRDVINKGVSDEQILDTARDVFQRGWTTLKLYFMLGLPTETTEDLLGIVDIARRIKALPEARGKDLTVSVSTMVPKPHTPFQWARQLPPAEVRERQRLLATELRKAKINFRYHDSFSSLLEGVMARADRRIAGVIQRAYELGCRLDAWEEHLKPELWLQAFAECGIDPEFYLRERILEEVLPWDHLSCDIDKDYLKKEYQRALRDQVTPDCLTQSCSTCGACNYDDKRNVLWPRDEAAAALDAVPRAVSSHRSGTKRPPVQRLTVRYSKQGPICFIGHLELVDVFHRGARRAELPLAYSQGFHPLPRISFGPPLQLGVESDAEYLELYLTETLLPEAVLARYARVLPPGLELCAVSEESFAAPSIQERICAHRFCAQCLKAPDALRDASVEGLLALEVQRSAKGGKKPQRVFRLADCVSELEFDLAAKSKLSFTLEVDSKRASLKASEVVERLTGLTLGEYNLRKLDTLFKAQAADPPPQAGLPTVL